MPAISICTQGVSPTNSPIIFAPVIDLVFDALATILAAIVGGMVQFIRLFIYRAVKDIGLW